MTSHAHLLGMACDRLIYATEYLWGTECLLNLYIVVTYASRYVPETQGFQLAKQNGIVAESAPDRMANALRTQREEAGHLWDIHQAKTNMLDEFL